MTSINERIDLFVCSPVSERTSSDQHAAFELLFDALDPSRYPLTSSTMPLRGPFVNEYVSAIAPFVAT